MRIGCISENAGALPCLRIKRDISRALRVLAGSKRGIAPPAEILIIALAPSAARSLNRRMRNAHGTPNVLSLRYDEHIAEIFLTPAIIRRDATRLKNSYHTELRWMVIHGFLHILGIHHERSLRAAAEFERFESSVLQSIGIAVRR